MKTTTLALCAAAAALVPSVAVVAFVPATPTLSPGGSRSKEATTRIIMAAPANEEGAAGVSRGGFLKSAALALGGGLLATTATGIGSSGGSSSQWAAQAVPASEAPDLSPILLSFEGKPRRFGDIIGKKATLLVNVASYCALTPQYPALERLYEQFHDQGLEVIGVGCNQFGGQEPEKMEKVRKDMRDRYGVQFTLYDKIEVNGPGRHPLYSALFQYEPELSGYPTRIAWNFEKFLLGEKGKEGIGVPIRRYRPGVEPEELATDIEALVKTGTLPPARKKKSLNDF